MLVLAPSTQQFDVGESDPESTAWRAELVAKPGGRITRIALDPDGRPHGMFCSGDEVTYAVRLDPGWNTERIVARGDVVPPFTFLCGDLVIGVDGEPQMYELDASGASPRIYGVRSGTWALSPTSQAGAWETEYAIDSTGVLHAVWFRVPTDATQPIALEYGTLRSVTSAGTEWETEVVDTFLEIPHVMYWASLAFDDADRPHILYYVHDGMVRLATKDAAWTVHVIERVGLFYRTDFGITPYWGSVAVSPDGTVYAAYLSADVGLRFATRTVDGWTVETLDGPPTQPSYPHVLLSPGGLPRIGYQRWDVNRLDVDLMYATFGPAGWTTERIWDPFAHAVIVPEGPSFAIDRCDNPHILAAEDIPLVTLKAVWYLTRGVPCPPEGPDEGIPGDVSFDFNPNTLNVKSEGNWVMARLTVRNGSAADIDPTSLALNGVAVDRWSLHDNGTLKAKFDRAAVQSTVPLGESVEVVLTGMWRNGTPFRATDTIRVIDPGR